MKKRLFGVILLLVMICSCVSVSAAAGIRVFVDHVRVQFDVEPQIVNDRTMVPLRAIFEAMGASVEWDERTRTVTAWKGSRVVKSTVGETTMYVNGKAVEMDTAPMIIEGRTLVPARFVAEAFNCTVDWVENTRSVTITTNKDEKDAEPIEKPNCYPGTDVPTYTSVTGVEQCGQSELQGNLPVYKYKYESHTEYQAFTDALKEQGWKVTTEDDKTTETITEYAAGKGNKYVIAYIFWDMREVWIVCGTE